MTLPHLFRFPPTTQCALEYARQHVERLGASSFQVIILPLGSEYSSHIDDSLSAFARLLLASLGVYSSFSRPNNVSVVDYSYIYSPT